MESDAYATAACVLGVTQSQKLLGAKVVFGFCCFGTDPRIR